MSRGRKPSVTREHILERASELFRANGIRATSIEEIAENAGIAKGSLLKHFQKEDLAMEYLKQEESLITKPLELISLKEKTGRAMAREFGYWISDIFHSESGKHGVAHFRVIGEYPDSQDALNKECRAFRKRLSKKVLLIAESAGFPVPENAAKHVLNLLDEGHMAAMFGGRELTELLKSFPATISDKRPKSWLTEQRTESVKFACVKCQNVVRFFFVSNGNHSIELEIDKVTLAGFERRDKQASVKIEIESHVTSEHL